MPEKILKHIAIDELNYLSLKRLGGAGDSFNDVVSRLLELVEQRSNLKRATQFKEGGALDK